MMCLSRIRNRIEKITPPLSVGVGTWRVDWFGPELMFGIEMGDYFKEPVLLIKTCWGGHSLYDEISGRQTAANRHTRQATNRRRISAQSYHKMVKEVRECLAHLTLISRS